MEDIDLNGMAFVCGGKTYRLPFDPPMSTYREARERVVEMDKQCLQALGKSDITIKEFVPPTSLYLVEFMVIMATFIAYSQRWWFTKGAVVERILGHAFARFSWTIQPWLITFVVGIHVVELAYFIRNHLRRHSVNIRTALWWKWVGTTFIEGQFAYKRFNDLVSRKQEEKVKQKHKD